MTTIIKSVVINATRDTIRKYYAHPVLALQWAFTITEWEPDEAWPAVGTTAKMMIKSGGLTPQGVATTLAYDNLTLSHHWRFEPDGILPPFEVWFTCDEQDGQTTAAQRVEYTIPGSFLGKALDKLFVERQNAKDIQQQLDKLKTLAEADPD
jgi:hypothetical protein